jgi:hypothetical protein
MASLVRLIGNMDDPKYKQRVSRIVSSLSGLYEIILRPRSRIRTSPQNRFYWGVIIPATQNGLQEVTGERYTKKECHQMLKGRFLVETVDVGEEVGTVSYNGHTWDIPASILKKCGVQNSSVVSNASLGLLVKELSESCLRERKFLRFTPSTAKLSIEEFASYCEDCVNFIARYLGINIPEPEEDVFLRDKRKR